MYYILEDLFYKYGVDLILYSHQYAYERMWPVYRGEVTSRDYDDPTAPIYITSGYMGNMGNDAYGIPGRHSMNLYIYILFPLSY